VRNPFNGAVWIPIGEPERFDVVVFRYPENPSQDFIKRVIGLPGETVQITNKEVFVNGVSLENDPGVHKSDHIIPKSINPRDNYGPVTVPAHSLFVMGDNRDNSHDSRFWGFVDYKDLKGKALILYWSWDKGDFDVRWQRFGRVVH
jgi:signal peptidase I